MPGLVWFILVGFVGMAVMWPTAYSRIKERALGPAPQLAQQQGSTAANLASSAQAQPVPGSMSPASAPSSTSPTQGDKPARAFAGCAVWRGQCTCHDDDGRRAKVEPEICAAETTFGEVRKQDHQVAAQVDARGYALPPAPPTQAELDAMAWIAKNGR